MRLAGDERLTAAVRRGDRRAFEVVYDRYSAELLRFGVYMLGSQHDAEDAVQATFAAAYRALMADDRTIALRPWLFTIARNECVSILRNRRQMVGLSGELAPPDDPVHRLEVGEEVREMLAAMRDLPEQQRTALVLAEAQGLTHPEIAAVLGVATKQVKAFVYQARANLLADRRAREAACEEIRTELAEARGPLLLQGRLRRHLRHCQGCREYAASLARQRRRLHVSLPFIPSIALKHRTLEGALGLGGGCTGAAATGASIAGLAEMAGGVNALIAKVLAGVVALSATAGVGASVVGARHPPGRAAAFLARSPSTGAASAAGTKQGGSRSMVKPAERRSHEQRRVTTAAPSASGPAARVSPTSRERRPPAVSAQSSTLNAGNNGASNGRGGSKPQAIHGTPKRNESEKARGREGGRAQRLQAHEKSRGKHEEHTPPQVKKELGGAEAHHPEGVAKGPPTEEALQQKHEGQEEHKAEHGPPKASE
ncbi:MAG: polymerase, sigma-24 subunit, subfamily [Solirubrobacterales bacterium]|nr:polymerase, sigma-24 subunit, subfamily [Solirubrobacterales bacterium]